MKKIILSLVALATTMVAMAASDTPKKGQIIGGDFEKWHKASFSGQTSDEPNGWHSFMSGHATKSLYEAALKNTHTFICNETRPGSTGKQSVKLTSGIVKVVFVQQPANGTITTGRLIAGSATANDPANCSMSNPSETAKDGNGDPFYAPLTTRPDSIVAWVKFKQGKLSDSNAKYKYATMSAILHGNSKYQDPEDATYANVVAKAVNNTIESNDFKWQRISVPFDYKKYASNNAEPHFILITFSTNAEPGVASTSADNPDVMIIDDVELIYNKEYTDDLVISANGITAPAQKATIVVTEYLDGTYNMMLKNFTFGEGEEALPIGDVTMANLKPTNNNGTLHFTTEQDATITNGGEVAEMLNGKIHLKMEGDLKNDKLSAVINLEVFNQKIVAVFGKVENSVKNISVSNNNEVTAIYDMAGRKLNKIQNGVNIVRKADGTTIKVIK